MAIPMLLKQLAVDLATGVLRRFGRQVRDGEKITVIGISEPEPTTPLSHADAQRIVEMSKVGPADRALAREKLEARERALQPPPRKAPKPVTLSPQEAPSWLKPENASKDNLPPPRRTPRPSGK